MKQHRIDRRRFAQGIITIATIVAGATGTVFGVTARRSPEAIQLLRSLQEISERPVPGQNIGHANGDIASGVRANWLAFRDVAGKFPRLLGVDYGYHEIPDQFEYTNHWLIDHGRKGGWVTVSMHPANPWFDDSVSNLHVGSFDDLRDRSTKAGRRWHDDLDRIARGLRQLQAQNIPVLWRPLHESNGDWFWWSRQRQDQPMSQTEFEELWRHLYNYLTHNHQLDNLLWVYSVSANGARPSLELYPGNEWVDIVGIDYYGNDLTQIAPTYHELIELGKPIGLTELGPDPSNPKRLPPGWRAEIASRYPALRYFMFWHRWPGVPAAMVDHIAPRRVAGDESSSTQLNHQPGTDANHSE